MGVNGAPAVAQAAAAPPGPLRCGAPCGARGAGLRVTLQPQFQGGGEDQHGAGDRGHQEEPQEDSVKDQGHKFPVLHHL